MLCARPTLTFSAGFTNQTSSTIGPVISASLTATTNVAKFPARVSINENIWAVMMIDDDGSSILRNVCTRLN